MKYYMPEGDWPLHIEGYKGLMKSLGFIPGSREDADFLLLPGGADIGMRPERDVVETQDFNEFYESRKVVGICRGMQLGLHLLGGSLIEDIPVVETKHTTQSGHWKGDSSWHRCSSGFAVNSRHHQGFYLEGVPPGIEVLCTSADGIVEAVMNERLFGVQWHPENPEMEKTRADLWWRKTLYTFLNK